MGEKKWGLKKKYIHKFEKRNCKKMGLKKNHQKSWKKSGGKKKKGKHKMGEKSGVKIKKKNGGIQKWG